MELSTEILLEEVQSVVLETGEPESQEEPYANASFEIISHSSFHREQQM